jgi:hypothetical protein
MEKRIVTVKAYCIYCKKNTEGKIKEIRKTDSGKYLHIGECPVCYYEIKRLTND